MSQTKAGAFFAHIKEQIDSFFHVHPTTSSVIDAVIAAMKQGQLMIGTGAVVKIATMFPHGIGTKALADVNTLINQGIPTLEIGREVAADTAGITDPAQLADATVTSVLRHMHELPAEWQGKHFEDTVALICHKVLDLPLDEIELIIKAKMKVPATV